MYKQIIFVTLLATWTVINGQTDSQTYGWTYCAEPTLGDVIGVKIQGCNMTPCTFVRGESYSLAANVTSNTNTATLPFNVTGTTFLGLSMLIKSGNACDYLKNNRTCPVEKWDIFNFAVENEVPAYAIPGAKVVVETVVTNDPNDATFLEICVKFDAIIK